MFVTVRYGENRSKIFNAHCRNENLLENIKLQCGCRQKEVVEVADERGVVKNLRNFPTDYGSHFLKERETVVLLSVQNSVSDDPDNGSTARPIFTPLLASLRYDHHFNETLNQASDTDPTENNSNSKQQQQQQQQLAAGDAEDDAMNKVKVKTKVASSNNSPVSPPKKSILRKATKTSNRK